MDPHPNPYPPEWPWKGDGREPADPIEPALIGERRLRSWLCKAREQGGSIEVEVAGQRRELSVAALTKLLRGCR